MVWQVSLGGGVKTLGEGVKTRAGPERHAIVGISISRPLLLMVHKSLGGGVQSLGDGVKTGAGSEWHSMVSITIKSGIGISSIAVVAIGGIAVVAIGSIAMVAIGIGVAAIGIVGIG